MVSVVVRRERVTEITLLSACTLLDLCSSEHRDFDCHANRNAHSKRQWKTEAEGEYNLLFIKNNFAVVLLVHQASSIRALYIHKLIVRRSVQLA